MIIERGMQPNCSELIIRLSGYDSEDRTYSVEKIKEELDKIGIREYLLKNYYDFMPPTPTNWDVEDDHKEIVVVKDLPKKVQKLLAIADDYTQEEGKQEKARKDLADLGFDLHKSTVVLLDSEKPLVMPNGTISVNKTHDDGGPAIVGHQHCNWDMFPVLKKISEHFGEEVHAYDGGSIDEYNRFLDGEEPDNE